MRYSPEELKLYRVIESALAPYFVVLQIMITSPFLIGLILNFIDIFLNTSFTASIETMIINNAWPVIFGPIFILINSIGIITILTTKYFGKLFSKQKRELQKSISMMENISIIEVKMSGIEKTIKKILFLRKILSWITTKKSFTSINDYFKSEISIFISSILNLRSDLQLRLAEQQKTLEQAKSEVEQTIKGSTELEQVSELQQARLDRQIEQFEELQRVLVKV